REDEVGSFALYQNEPNPFRTTTTIGYQIPNQGTVELKISDITGRELFTREINSIRGYNSVEIDRKLFPATGIYYYTVTAGSFTATKGLVVLE
ncbi:MAG TPA: T9SS type A sorting domain-containing protein, partial [Saprospiraceae bacterium]|nr:T9SS type A sorting domain-containing protein [Saprospiraceae bacterium]